MSSQSAATLQASFLRQPLAAVQYSSAAQLALFGACAQAPLRQSSSVQLTPSSQSVLVQHSPQEPLQHFSVASHFGPFLQSPSAPH
jgi:hypothetical protein